MRSKGNRDVHGAGDGISREVVGVDAHERRAARTRSRNVELSAQQHGARRARQHIRGAGIDDVSDQYMRGGLSFNADTENEEMADDGSDDIADV